MIEHKLPVGITFFTIIGVFYTSGSQIQVLKLNSRPFLICQKKYLRLMQVDLNSLVNSYEVDPVSIGNPFKSLVIDPSTMEVLRFLPIIAFIALLFAAIWRQGKKFPIKAEPNGTKHSTRRSAGLPDSASTWTASTSMWQPAVLSWEPAHVKQNKIK